MQDRPLTPDDAGLLRRVAAGDQEALRVLFDRHQGVMIRMLQRYGADSVTAEEISQEAWLAIWQSAGTFRWESSVRSWLLGVARRKAHDEFRRRRPTPVDQATEDEEVDRAAQPEDQALAHVVQDELIDQVRELPDHLREVVELVLAEDLGYAEVGAVLGLPVGTVKSRMSKARGVLASRLAGGAAADRVASPDADRRS